MSCVRERVNDVVCVRSGRICARERVNVYVRVIVCACIGTRVCLFVGVSVRCSAFPVLTDRHEHFIRCISVFFIYQKALKSQHRARCPRCIMPGGLG